MPAKLTNQQFLERANQIHNGKYSYPEEYILSSVKLKIECSIHGIFEQLPSSHLVGRGCDKCGGTANNNTINFIKTSISIHGNKYDYGKSEYILCDIELKIICFLHGEFMQTPATHLGGSGCPKCAYINSSRKRTKSTKQFIVDGKLAHGDKYDYSISKYIGCEEKIKIICPIHGIFEQVAITHICGHGCPKCGDNQRSNAEEFKIKASLVHHNMYNYDEVEYIDAKIKIKIRCFKHGIFEQKPNSHLNGHGCSKCTKIISKPETEWLDELNVPYEWRQRSFFIDNKLIKPDAFDPTTNTIYEFYGDYWHGNPTLYHSEKENASNYKKFGDLYQTTMDREKLLKDNGYKIVSIWESEWYKIVKRGASK